MITGDDLSPYLDHSRSTKSPISGLPAAIGAAFQINKNLSRFAKQASDEYQEEIRKRARLVWGDAADSIYVIYNDKDESINIVSFHPNAHTLEYGDGTTPPQPILRNAANGAQEHLGNRISELMNEVIR